MEPGWMVFHGWYLKGIDNNKGIVTFITRDFKKEIEIYTKDILYDENKDFTLKERYEIAKFLFKNTVFLGSNDVQKRLEELMLAFVKDSVHLYSRYELDFDNGLVIIYASGSHFTFDFVNDTSYGENENSRMDFVMKLFDKYVGADIYGKKLAC